MVSIITLKNCEISIDTWGHQPKGARRNYLVSLWLPLASLEKPGCPAPVSHVTKESSLFDFFFCPGLTSSRRLELGKNQLWHSIILTSQYSALFPLWPYSLSASGHLWKVTLHQKDVQVHNSHSETIKMVLDFCIHIWVLFSISDKSDVDSV